MEGAMARRRGIDLEQTRPLRLVEDLEGVACVTIDKAGSAQLGKQTMMLHLAMMAAFITVILAPVAWIVALLNILLSPKVAADHIESTPHGVRLRKVYLRGEPSIDTIRSPPSTGPLPLGLGTPSEQTVLPFSEMTGITWNDYALSFHFDEMTHELLMELTPPADIARLGEELSRARARAVEGLTMTRDEAAVERARLAHLVQKPQSQH
jgi:hypothetical protein